MFYKLLLVLSLCLILEPVKVISQVGVRNQNHTVPNKRTTTTSTTAPTSTTTRSLIANRNNRTRIVGGVETQRNEYPFIVSLSRLGQHFCGGSIIDKSWVITAAHCVTRPDFNLTAGEHDLRIKEGTEQLVTAEKVIRHPKYNPVTFEDDIALVKVFPPFSFTEYVKSFNLPSVHFVALGNVTTAGWGVVDEGSQEVSPVLRKVTIGLSSNMECVKMYGKEFHPHKMICAGQENGGKDACQGDSGGPLLCGDYHNGATLCGIVSFGFGCARADFFGVYTKVANYADWITWEQSDGLWSTYEPQSTPSVYAASSTIFPNYQNTITKTRRPPRQGPGSRALAHTLKPENLFTIINFILLFATGNSILNTYTL